MSSQTLEQWEQEILAGHRWKRVGEEEAKTELARLQTLRREAGALTPDQQKILIQVMGPEICNWALLESISTMCKAIGDEKPAEQGTGHRMTITPDRWRQIWAYYFACRQWLTAKSPHIPKSYQAIMDICDPQGKTLLHIKEMLGEQDNLKELYVERFCICMEAWLDDLPPEGRPRRTALETAAAAIEQKILDQEPQPRVPFNMIHLNDHSILQACHHKLFRRYDIILSSIGDGEWRKSMPMRGTDGEDRATELEPYLTALEKWPCEDTPTSVDSPARDMYKYLGKHNAFKRFAAALLGSLLRSQQISARRKAMQRAKS